MKVRHYIVIGLLLIGLLYVYHTFIANPGGFKAGLRGLGINR